MSAEDTIFGGAKRKAMHSHCDFGTSSILYNHKSYFLAASRKLLQQKAKDT